MRISAFLLLSASLCLLSTKASAQPRLARPPSPAAARAAGTVAGIPIPEGARPLSCTIVLANWISPVLEVVNPGPAKVEVGETVIARANPGGQTSMVLQNDLGKDEHLGVSLPVKVSSACAAYVPPHGASGSLVHAPTMAAAITEGPKRPLSCSAGNLGPPIGTRVMLSNPGPKPIPKGAKVAYALEGSSEVWHSLLPYELVQEGQVQVPSHINDSALGPPSYPCRGWVGD